jgi:hypothetical protein
MYFFMEQRALIKRTKSLFSGVRYRTAIYVIGCSAAMIGTSAHAEATRRWTMTCTYAKSLKDDPIVFPNQPGASHLHDFYGNVGANANTTTFAALQQFASDCPQQDRSAYWVPTLYRNAVAVTPHSAQIYYENKSTAEPVITPFPPGYKMLLGNSKAMTQAQTEPHWVYACSDKTQYGDAPPSHCSSGGIQLRSEFPNCWNGVIAADGNATGNVVWANGLGLPGHGDKSGDPNKVICPTGYKIALPMVRIVLTYNTTSTVGTITLSSGSVYSKHGDFFNGWDPATL